MAVNVTNVAAEERYEARAGDQLAGYLQYRERPGLLALVHTEVDPRFEGQGIGGALASAALDDARARGVAVLPFCPFVNGYVRKHAEFADLVPDAHRDAFDL